ncbi:hypothetical protein FRC12_017884 [Ceratobasidium sp. 428]|nr:hypothetical protein FRC12_017884 [Ceratobasidium sp. 428]
MSSPSSGRPGSSSHTSVSAFNVAQPGHTHDRCSSLPTSPTHHTPTPASNTPANQDPFAYGPFEGNNDDEDIYPHVGAPVPGGPEFFVPRAAPRGTGLNPLPLASHPWSESPRSYEHDHPFELGAGGAADDG